MLVTVIVPLVCRQNKLVKCRDPQINTNKKLSYDKTRDAFVQFAVAVLGFSFWGATGVATLLSGGHTTNTFALNYRVCNRLYQIINT